MLYTKEAMPVVCIFDPAIDQDNSDINKYGVTREFSLLKFKETEKPQIYHVRRIPQSKVLNFMHHSVDVQRRLAFMSGVVRVENLHTDDGQVIDWFPAWTHDHTKPEIMTNDEVDQMHFPIDEIDEIGGVARNRAFLRRGRPVLYDPPDTSVQGLARLRLSSHLAEILEASSLK